MELDAPRKLNAKPEVFENSFWNKIIITTLTGIRHNQIVYDFRLY